MLPRSFPAVLWSVLLPPLMLSCQPEGEAREVPAPAESLISGAGQPLNPSPSPDGSALVYDRLTSTGNRDVYLVRPGQAPLNLTSDSPPNDVQPAFSPDGQWIAFRSERDGGGIFVMSASGQNVRRVVAEGFNPAWSPDGTEIVYSLIAAGPTPYGAAIGTNGLRFVNVQTGATRVVYAANAFQPRVSPNGVRVAFWHYGNPGVQRDIWTVRSDGSDTVRITNDEAVDWSPVWSPDGGHLLFASDRDGAMRVWRVAIDQNTGVTAGAPELVTADGAAQVRGQLSLTPDGALTYVDAGAAATLFRVDLDPATGALAGEPSVIVPPTYGAAGFAVSPDGEWVAFTSGGRQEDLYVIRSDGSGLRQLTNDPYRDRQLTWSPQGPTITWRSDRPVEDSTGAMVRAYRIYAIRPDGGDMRRLLATGPALHRWSPDGTRMISGNFAGTTPFSLSTADGSDPQNIGVAVVELPVWSRDGQWLAYRNGEGADGAAFVLDVSRPGSTAEALPPMNFTPGSWSTDGTKLAGSAMLDDRAVRTVVYDRASRRYTEVAEGGGGVAWLAGDRSLVFTRDEASRIQVVAAETGAVRDVASVQSPGVLSFALSPNGRTLFYLQVVPEASVFQVRLPR